MTLEKHKSQFLHVFKHDMKTGTISAFDSTIDCFCLSCGDYLELELDAKTGYCETCCKIVDVLNPLLTLGYI